MVITYKVVRRYNNGFNFIVMRKEGYIETSYPFITFRRAMIELNFIANYHIKQEREIEWKSEQEFALHEI